MITLRYVALVGLPMAFLFAFSCQTPISPENDGTSSPNFTWAVQYGTRGPDGLAVVNLDAAGNILVAGYQQIYTSDVTTFSAGWTDVAFVAQYSPSGALRWARRTNSSTSQPDITYGNSSGTIWRGVASDGGNNVYVVGEFRDTIRADTFQYASRGGSDILLAKYSANGTLLWMQPFGGKLHDAATAIAINNAGTIFITGYFTDSLRIGNTLLTGRNGSRDMFLCAMTGDGTLLWVRSGGGGQEDEGRRLVLDKRGNIYLVGAFTGGATFQSGGEIFSSDRDHPFLARYTPDGTLTLIREIGGSANDVTAAFPALDGDGNIILAGAFTGGATFDTVNFAALSSNYQTNSYIAKFTSELKVLWAKRYAAPSPSFNDLAIDTQGN